MGKWDMAIKDYTEAIFWTRQPARAYHGRGMAHGAKGDIDKAIEDFTKAIQHQPDYAEVHYHRGTLMSLKTNLILPLKTVTRQ